eukprot:SAG11_NODE_914_length_6565_cov_8.318126_4_plen_98_part_00
MYYCVAAPKTAAVWLLPGKIVGAEVEELANLFVRQAQDSAKKVVEGSAVAENDSSSRCRTVRSHWGVVSVDGSAVVNLGLILPRACFLPPRGSSPPY